MSSIPGSTPPWALRISLATIMLCLSLLPCVIYSLHDLQNLMAKYEVTQRQLQEHKHAARIIQEKLQRQKKLQHATPGALQMLFKLGAALTDDVAILTLDASLQKQEVRLDISATSLAAVLDFTARLQNIPVLVELQNHHVAKEKESGWPIRATVNIRFPQKVVNES